ncbi:MAG: hypothetical protein M1829_003725 [Trizodia sp. TS-e1964]|nr:MAG: hypothetical protein M1829_003725 [Trizodia sp. TS-e1964]
MAAMAGATYSPGAVQCEAKFRALIQTSQTLVYTVNDIAASGLGASQAVQDSATLIISQYTEIIAAVAEALKLVKSLDPLTDRSDGDFVKAAWVDLVQVHHGLLSTLIGKASFLVGIPIFKDPFTDVLKQLQNLFDNYNYALINFIPNNANDVREQQSYIGATITRCIGVFSVNLNISLGGLLGINLGELLGHLLGGLNKRHHVAVDKRHHLHNDASSEDLAKRHHVAVDSPSSPILKRHHVAVDKRRYVDGPSGPVLAAARVRDRRAVEAVMA